MRVGVILLALFLTACSQPKRVQTAVNSYHYYWARYEKGCGPESKSPRPFDCKLVYINLMDFWTDIGLAGDAAKRGGKFPLQLNRVLADEKGLKKLVGDK